METFFVRINLASIKIRNENTISQYSVFYRNLPQLEIYNETKDIPEQDKYDYCSKIADLAFCTKMVLVVHCDTSRECRRIIESTIAFVVDYIIQKRHVVQVPAGIYRDYYKDNQAYACTATDVASSYPWKYSVMKAEQKTKTVVRNACVYSVPMEFADAYDPSMPYISYWQVKVDDLATPIDLDKEEYMRLIFDMYSIIHENYERAKGAFERAKKDMAAAAYDQDKFSAIMKGVPDDVRLFFELHKMDNDR